jgi:uncharacterized protein YneF (UPF0154 family)
MFQWLAALIAVLTFIVGVAYGYSMKYIAHKERETRKKLIQDTIEEYIKQKEEKSA